MERINLSVLSGVSHEGMLQLKNYVDMTGSDAQYQSYDYECLFPETCNPREVCLSFVKTADKYIFRVNPHFRYDGSNSVMGILADTGAVSFSSWQDAEQALRTLTENVAGTTTSNATPDTLTNWDEISVPEQSESQTPSFEHLKERLQKMVIGQDDSTEAIAYVVAQHLAKKNPTKPVSILASGSPGVGKSKTAKALAKILSQDCGQEYAVSWTDLNNERNYMIQRPSQKEIEKGLAESKGDYKRLLRNITNCLEFDYYAICSLRKLLADSKEDIAEIKRTIRPYVVDLIYVLILDEKDLYDDDPWEDGE